jgi:hypothetical protein
MQLNTMVMTYSTGSHPIYLDVNPWTFELNISSFHPILTPKMPHSKNQILHRNGKGVLVGMAYVCSVPTKISLQDMGKNNINWDRYL